MPLDAFQRAIEAQPAADTPRLIWADYLAESECASDRARAQLIRVQCALARLPAYHPRVEPLKILESELIGEYKPQWSAALDGLVLGCEFRRGWIDSVTVEANQFAAHAEELFRLAPVRRVRVVGLGDWVGAFTRTPALARIAELDLSGIDLTPECVKELMHADRIAHLDTLELAFTGTEELLLRILAAGSFRNLRILGLGGNQFIGEAGVAALMRAAWFPGLVSLDLSDNQINSTAVDWLANSSLSDLKLATNPLGDSGVVAFARSAIYSRIVERTGALNLCRVSVGRDGLAALGHAAASRKLRQLSLTGNPFGDEGVAVLSAGQFEQLSHLNLSETGLTDRGAFRLAQSVRMQSLSVLDVSNNRLTQAGIDALWAARRCFRTTIDTTGNFASPDLPGSFEKSVEQVLSRLSGMPASSGYTDTSSFSR